MPVAETGVARGEAWMPAAGTRVIHVQALYGAHPDAQGAADISDGVVADEDRLFRRNADSLQRTVEDARVRLEGTDSQPPPAGNRESRASAHAWRQFADPSATMEVA